jgi:hypothetical protein
VCKAEGELFICGGVDFSLYNAEGQKISTSVHGKEGVFFEKIKNKK